MPVPKVAGACWAETGVWCDVRTDQTEQQEQTANICMCSGTLTSMQEVRHILSLARAPYTSALCLSCCSGIASDLGWLCDGVSLIAHDPVAIRSRLQLLITPAKGC